MNYRPIALRVVKLHPAAKLPVCAHPGEDLGYDIFAAEDTVLRPNKVTKVRTGIAIELPGMGFIMRDRSSMDMREITVSAGTMDPGYRGEFFVNMRYHSHKSSFGGFSLDEPYIIKAGEKIAQIIPIAPATHHPVVLVNELSKSARGTDGYGSTGR